MTRRPVIVRLASMRLDAGLLVATVVLALFGLAMVYDASSASAFRDFGDKFYYLRNQATWLVMGLAMLFVFAIVDYHWLIKLAPVIFWATVALLVLVLIPGVGTRILGARRWINLLGFNFQPAEAAKLANVIYLAALMRKQSRLGIFLTISAILGGLMLAEPDLGTAVVTLATGVVVYFVSGAPLGQFLVAVPALLITAAVAIFSSPYRRERISTFFGFQADPLGAAYQMRQVLLALGAGGLFGVGIGQSRQKYLFLPEVSTDAIFAVIAEEMGFVGALVLICAFLWIFFRGLSIAKMAMDSEGKLLAVGITSLLAFQALINLGAMVALVPLTGIPLPFFSYGGSSLIVSLSAVGILLNISRQRVAKI